MTIPSTAVTVASLRALLQRLPLLAQGQLAELERTVLAGANDVPAWLGRPVQGGWLTAYQANQLARGCGEELLLGRHVVLERLGQGGMGTVYKARHLLLDRIVAVKVIRPELLAYPGAVARF